MKCSMFQFFISHLKDLEIYLTISGKGVFIDYCELKPQLNYYAWTTLKKQIKEALTNETEFMLKSFSQFTM